MKTGLIIDDNEDNMMLIKRFLKRAGYATLWASTGYKGIEEALSHNPDFILLDIQLPDIDGTEVLRMLKDAPQSRHIPVIVVTSYDMEGNRERFLAAGCAAYLETPVDSTRIIEQVKNVLGE